MATVEAISPEISKNHKSFYQLKRTDKEERKVEASTIRFRHEKMSVDEHYNSQKDEEDPISWIHHAHKIRRGCFRRFSVENSTEDHFAVNVHEEEPIFVGAFGHIRKHHLDHKSFHKHYCKERQWLHDSIIEDYLENSGDTTGTLDDECAPQWLIFTAGVQGAGKHHSMRALREEHSLLLPQQSFCYVDTDELRRLLPEYDFYCDHAPELVDMLTQKEAGYIAETLCWAALHANQSVFWDTSLQYASWFAAVLVPHLRQSMPELKVAVLHVTAPSPAVVQQRRELKELVTGRHLFPDELEYVEAEMHRIEQSVECLRPVADFVVTICNREEDLEIMDGNWDRFLSAFLRQDESPPSSMDKEEEPTPRLRRVSDGCLGLYPVEAHRENNAQKRSKSCFLSSSIARSNMLQSAPATGRRGTSRRRFSVLRSTEENHCSDDLKFYGRFANIRASLDYSYHKNYTFERQRFQDSIIQYFLRRAVVEDKDGVLCTTPTQPWIVFTAGPMGAGKSYTMRQLVNRGRFPLVAFVNVDPDELRHKLPEYHLYINQSPETAGDMTRKEAGFLTEILTLAALQQGKNVLLDGSLRDSEWYKLYFAKLRRDFPILRLAIIQVTAPWETILERAAVRARETGRIVPEALLRRAYDEVPRSVEILGPLVDYHVTISNPPNTRDVKLVTKGETWESFTARWAQTCAWVPKPKVQNMLRLGKRASESTFATSTSHEEDYAIGENGEENTGLPIEALALQED